MNKATDILVKTPNPAALDAILQQFGAVLIQDDLSQPTYLKREGCYVARCLGSADFVEFVLKNQGYAQVVKRLENSI